MNKFTLVLIFSVIAFINGAVDYFRTEPYYSFDWLDEDKQSFTIQYSDNSNLPNFCYLYNNSRLCKPECGDPSNNAITCELAGDSCKADGDNPAYKYYYAVYCDKNHASNTNYTKNASPEQIHYYIVNTTSGPSGDVGVTIAVCSGSFLKYSLILLSLLIL